MSVNLYVKIEIAGGKTLECDFCYEYPEEVSQTNFMKACIENYNAQHDSEPCPELKVSGYEILVNGSLLRARVLKENFFQNPDVDEDLEVKVITLRPQTTGRTSPAPEVPPAINPIMPLVINTPISTSSGESLGPGQLSTQEIIILQNILKQASNDFSKFPIPITQTAHEVYDEKDIRQRSVKLARIILRLSLLEPILSASAGNLVGDLAEVRKYAKDITMPPIGVGKRDDPTLPYYVHVLGLPFPMENLERLIANHNRLVNSPVYVSMKPTVGQFLKYCAADAVNIRIAPPPPKVLKNGSKVLTLAHCMASSRDYAPLFNAIFNREMTAEENNIFNAEYKRLSKRE